MRFTRTAAALALFPRRRTRTGCWPKHGAIVIYHRQTIRIT